MENEEKYGLTLEQMQALGGVIKEKVKELTTDDYNYPTDNPDGIAMWLLDDGIYRNSTGSNLKFYRGSYSNRQLPTDFSFVKLSFYGDPIVYFGLDEFQKPIYYTCRADGSVAKDSRIITNSQLVDNLNYSGSPGYQALDAHQGRVLKDLVDSLAIRGAGAPTTSTVGQVGTLYEDTTNGDLYICTDATNPYVWEGVGGGSITPVQTTGTSTTDVMSQNATTSMVYADPADKTLVAIGGGNHGGMSGYGVGIGYGARPGANGVAIGGNPSNLTQGQGAVALGHNASATYQNSIAFTFGEASATGVADFSVSRYPFSGGGYSSSKYRLLTGLYDPQSDHDAATKGYVDPSTDTTAPTTSTVGRLGEIRIDTSTNTAYMCVSADDVTPAYEWRQITA